MLLPKGCEILFILNFVLNRIATATSTQEIIYKSPVEVTNTEMASRATKIFGCDFEVFGRVQGVFFRKFTDKQTKQLGLRGWCMNTHDGTVRGQLEGPQNELNEMKHWLLNKGSPQSRIDKANFSEMKEIHEYTFKSFDIKR